MSMSYCKRTSNTKTMARNHIWERRRVNEGSRKRCWAYSEEKRVKNIRVMNMDRDVNGVDRGKCRASGVDYIKNK